MSELLEQLQKIRYDARSRRFIAPPSSRLVTIKADEAESESPITVDEMTQHDVRAIIGMRVITKSTEEDLHVLNNIRQAIAHNVYKEVHDTLHEMYPLLSDLRSAAVRQTDRDLFEASDELMKLVSRLKEDITP